MACPPPDCAFLRELVFAHSGNVLDPRRDHLFDQNLKRLIQAQGLSCLSELVTALRVQPYSYLARAVAEAMTVNETSFFRDSRPFELMRLNLLPKLIQSRRHIRKLTLWSAACSTGQEAYSLAILLRESFPALAGWKLTIVGTDICARTIQQAHSGRYSKIEVNRGLPPAALAKYFHQKDDTWEVAPEIRTICTFRQITLHTSLALRAERFDGILLRNVMLYFSEETRRQLVTAVHRVLAPDGFLILGSSEQTAAPTLWEPVLSHKTCYYRPLP